MKKIAMFVLLSFCMLLLLPIAVQAADTGKDKKLTKKTYVDSVTIDDKLPLLGAFTIADIYKQQVVYQGRKVYLGDVEVLSQDYDGRVWVVRDVSEQKITVHNIDKFKADRYLNQQKDAAEKGIVMAPFITDVSGWLKVDASNKLYIEFPVPTWE